jgi:SNF2 family DNA or RNA helicase
MGKEAALDEDVELQEHQQRVVDRMNAGDNRLLLYHGLGSGKSLSSIAAAESAGGPYGVMVPAALKPNYQKEVEKFTTGSRPEILSYTGVGAGKQFTAPPRTVIADEAHRLRNPSSASGVAARKLTDQAENLLLLTGTPITNEPSDVAPLLSMLNKKTITPEAFNQDFVGHKKVYPNWWSRLLGRNAGEEAFVKNESKLRSLLHGKVDYQPSKTPEGVTVDEQTVNVPLTPAQNRIQKAIRSKIPPGWAWKLDKEFPLTRAELTSLNSFLTGLRQSSLSTQPFRADGDPNKAFRDSGKLQRAFQDLKTELDSDPRKKSIVYSNYIGAGLEPYAAALAKAKIPYGMYHGGIPMEQRRKQLEEYNTGKLRALLLGPAAAEGISTKGTNMIQLLDPHWHESRSNQAKGRGLRFDSHNGLPLDLKNVAVRRYISESKEPSLIMRLLGAKRQRTGDEILQQLAAQKEKRNDKFRKILQEEGTPKVASAVDAVFRQLRSGHAVA